MTVTLEGQREEKWYSGRIPGVVEEALESLKTGQPLFLVGAFGGAAAMVIDLLEGRPREDFTWDYQRAAPHAEGMRALYQARGPAWEDYNEMTNLFRAVGVAGLANQNGLTVEENQELFWTRNLARTVELLMEGLTRIISR